MQTLPFQGKVDADGKLRLELPVDLPPGPVDGVVTLQGAARPIGPPYKSLHGILKGAIPAEADIDADLKEIKSGWKKRLETDP